jgi:uncharacterized membrane protein
MQMGKKLVALTFEELNENSAAWESVHGSWAPEAGELPMGDEPEQAASILKYIEKKAKKAGVKLEDAVIVYKTKSGDVKVKQTKDITLGKGAGRGAFWGLLIGILFGGPLGGVLGGLGIGAIYGRLVDHGVDDKFIQDVGGALKPSTSALLILIREEDYDGAIAYLKTFDSKIYEADLGKCQAYSASRLFSCLAFRLANLETFIYA